jgi:hypothetical protein
MNFKELTRNTCGQFKIIYYSGIIPGGGWKKACLRESENQTGFLIKYYLLDALYVSKMQILQYLQDDVTVLDFKSDLIN